MTARPILVTGGSGQLAHSLCDLAAGRRIVRVGRPEFDFDAPETIGAVLDRVAPGLVLNAAAYIAVDRAESDAEAARRANATGPELLARWCAAHDAQLIHVSTDYVFDGNKGSPYTEDDAPNPIGVYGASKLAGETAVLAALPGAIVLRTSCVYAAHGRNFVRTMLAAAQKTDRLRVVGDQIGCPTATDDLAAAMWAIADQLIAGSVPATGVFHAAGSGATSWHGLAEAVFAAAAGYGRVRPTVAAITTADWPTPVRRPADSRLDCGRLRDVFGLTLPDWRSSVAATVARICTSEPPPTLGGAA